MTQYNDHDWWRGAVIYQIYPRSFYDTNNDGIGDLPGITKKLPYIASLGVDAIWISPFFTSPMKDFGYDVSDYCDVDPIFGCLDDFKTLTETAHKLNIKVIIDQVLSHTSDQHEWFKESKLSKNNSLSDWYVWADPKEDGTAPNNWMSFFGGSAWTFDSRREQYYLHNFLSSQPDLNFHNPEVQQGVLDVLKFWLDLGVDGFRLDTSNMYFCDAELRDNPPRDKSIPIKGMNASNPRGYQAQVYGVNRPENAVFLERIRALMDQYPGSTTLGEIGSAEDPLAVMAEYTRGDDRLHMCYTADLLSEEKSPQFIRAVMEETNGRLSDSWPCWSLGNHDSMRFVSRWGEDVKDKTAFSNVMLALLTSLKGSICLYQGEELGLTEAEVPFDRLVDPFGIAFWPDYKGRDGCRTPMVWNTETHGGFTAGEPWLPVPDNHLTLAVEQQTSEASSVLNASRRFLAFRKEIPALIKGDIEFIEATDQLLVFKRTTEDQQVLMAFNLSDQTIDFPITTKLTPVFGHGFKFEQKDKQIILPPWQAFFGLV